MTMTTSNSERPKMIGEYTVDYLVKRANEIVKERTKDWEIINQAAEDRIPKFTREEIELGNIFGKGGFFTVSEIKRIHIEDDENDENDAAVVRSVNQKDEDEDYINSVVQDRKFMSAHVIRNDGKDCRYAFKTMRTTCRTDPTLFVNTIVDMALEAKFLSAVRHPNIIKMRAMAVGNTCQSEYFIVLDRLYDTLNDRFKKWQKKESNGFAKLFDLKKKKEKTFLAQRLTVAYDVASAIEYLHNLNIIYRDLKPNNIGFDVRDDVKIFDFGLATEYDPDNINKNSAFKLTGDTGTIRYMAPEVALNQPYNETADVYSFSVLLWQIIALKDPYEGLPDQEVERKVLYAGYRPKIDPQWSNALRRLMHDCFASNPRRPHMDVVCDVLRHEINKLSDKKELSDWTACGNFFQRFRMTLSTTPLISLLIAMMVAMVSILLLFHLNTVEY